MIRDYIRKVSFGLGVNENPPSDPLVWAQNQFDTVPNFIWDKKPSLITTKITTRSSYLLFGSSFALSYLFEKMINKKSNSLKKKEEK